MTLRDKYYALYDLLPPDIAERAKENWDEEFAMAWVKEHRVVPSSRQEALEYGFSWDDTIESYKYWHLVFHGNYDSARELLKQQ